MSNNDGKTAAGPTEAVKSKKTATTEPEDVTNAAALAAPGSDEVDPSPDDPVPPGAVRKTYQVGPIEVKPGQNNIASRAARCPSPTERLDRAHRAEPPPRRRHRPARRRHPPPPRRLAQPQPQGPHRPGLPERFFAAGEEKTISSSPAGYGYPSRRPTSWSSTTCSTTSRPSARRSGSPTTSTSSRHAPAAADIKPAARSGWTCRTADLPGVRRDQGQRRDGRTPTPTTPTKPYGDGRRRTTGRSRPTACCRDRRPPPPRRPADRPLLERAGADGRREASDEGGAARHRPPVLVGGELLRAGRRRVVGRVDASRRRTSASR